MLSAREPSVVARTWAKMSFECVFGAMRSRLTQFHAGRVEVKMHGSGPSSGSVYHPMPNPSPLCGLLVSSLSRESYDCTKIECDGSVTSFDKMMGFEPLYIYASQ